MNRNIVISNSNNRLSHSFKGTWNCFVGNYQLLFECWMWKSTIVHLCSPMEERTVDLHVCVSTSPYTANTYLQIHLISQTILSGQVENTFRYFQHKQLEQQPQEQLKLIRMHICTAGETCFCRNQCRLCVHSPRATHHTPHIT